MTDKHKNQLATKNDLKNFKDEIKHDVKNYMGVLYEKFENEVKIVAEQYTSIDKRLTKVESKTDMLIETVADIKVDTAMIREELGSEADKSEHKKLEHRVAVLESRA